jgi:hypothetical protein
MSDAMQVDSGYQYELQTTFFSLPNTKYLERDTYLKKPKPFLSTLFV